MQRFPEIVTRLAAMTVARCRTAPMSGIPQRGRHGSAVVLRRQAEDEFVEVGPAGHYRRDRSPDQSGQEAAVSIVRYDALGAEGGLARGGYP